MATGKTKEPQLIADLGENMKIYLAPLDSLREQDVNARILPTQEHNTLVNNIKKRGRLESVPYCAMVDGHIEIVSGHHRIIAAREAGVSECLVLVDESGLSRSEIVAKQLAHNRLSGFDDPQTLRRLFDMLDEPSLILESGLGSDMMEPPAVDLEQSITPLLDIGWKTVTLTFLPHQFTDFAQLLDTLPPSDMVGVVPKEQYEDFMKAGAQVRPAQGREVSRRGSSAADSLGS